MPDIRKREKCNGLVTGRITSCKSERLWQVMNGRVNGKVPCCQLWALLFKRINSLFILRFQKSLPCLAFPAGYVTARAHRSFPGLPPFYGEVKLALRDRPVVSAAGPLQFCLCSLLSPRSQCGRAGVKAGAQPHPQCSGG